MSAVPNNTAVVVETKSPWLSKINVTQVVAMVFTLVTAAGYTVPPDLQTAAMTAITALQVVATIVIKTWFTPTVTPQSMGK